MEGHSPYDFHGIGGIISKDNFQISILLNEIINDFSRKTWVYLLKMKDEAFKWFCTFKALVENQTEKKIKALRTVNGTKYESNEFNELDRKSVV